jgi:hypothetical protein
MNYINKDIKYIIFNLKYTKLFVFVNNSFVNNKDFNFQISYLIIIINKTKTIFIKTNKFIIKENLIYYNFTKTKRVT